MAANHRRAIRWLLRAILAFWPLLGHAEPGVLINFDASNPPFMYATGERADGLYPELIAAVFAQMKRPVKFAAKPWKRAVGELDLGEAGVGGIYKNEARLKKYDFSDPLFVERIVVYYQREKPLQYRSLADLYGKRVGVILGWSYGDDFDNARKAKSIAVEEVYADSQNFEKLAQGRLDAVLAIEQVGSRLMRASAHLGIEKSQVYLAENPTHLAFHKTQRMEALLKDFNRALSEIKASGAYTQIVDKVGQRSK